MQAGPLIDVVHLVEELGSANPPSLLDIRWSLARPDGRRHFADGHLPGAHYVDLEHELAGPGRPDQGRHPLPEPANLQRDLRSAGVRTRHPVVVYDDSGGLGAARAWWLLHWAGHPQVRLLDGGLGAWVANGGRLETGHPAGAGGGDLHVKPHGLPALTATEVAARSPSRLLIDSRSPERYRGDSEPIDAVAGHIPGAINLPTAANVDADGRFLHPDHLRTRFLAAGVDPDPASPPAIVYCGSGVTAAHQLLALQVAGLRGVLYPPSWSGWIADPAHPVSTGIERTGIEPTAG